MRPPLPLALALLLAAPLAPVSHAAESGSASSKTSKSTSTDSDEGDSGKSSGFFGRIFGKTPDPQPAPTKKTSSTSKSDPKGNSKTDAQKTETTGESKTDSKSGKKLTTKEKAPASATEAPKSDDERFAAAKKAANEEPKIAELRNKADNAVANNDANRFTKAYLKAMYSKMRSLEPTLKERIDLTEAAALRMIPE
ncbi:MAG: hypothetical protein WCO60_03995 [Verrucomicrobiota bacterium]